MPHLAGIDELGHRADRLLDRHRLVDAVLVVQIDVLDAEVRERPVDRLAHVLGTPDDRATAVGIHVVPELGREYDLVTPPRDRAADELLVLAHAMPVDVGGVEEEDPELERAMDRRDRLLFVGRAVPRRHPHAAEALRGDLEPLSERSRFHRVSLAVRDTVTRRSCP